MVRVANLTISMATKTAFTPMAILEINAIPTTNEMASLNATPKKKHRMTSHGRDPVLEKETSITAVSRAG